MDIEQKRKQRRESRRRFVAKMRDAGLCIDCKQPSVDGKLRCEACKKARNQGEHKRSLRYKAAGRCTKCGAVAVNMGYCERCRDAVRVRRQQQRDRVLAHYGGVCACCGEPEMIFLQIDHVNNDGATHRRQIGDTSIYGWLIRNGFPAGFQVLCANCNFAKRMAGSCPHAV